MMKMMIRKSIKSNQIRKVYIKETREAEMVEPAHIHQTRVVVEKNMFRVQVQRQPVILMIEIGKLTNTRSQALRKIR